MSDKCRDPRGINLQFLETGVRIILPVILFVAVYSRCKRSEREIARRHMFPATSRRCRGDRRPRPPIHGFNRMKSLNEASAAVAAAAALGVGQRGATLSRPDSLAALRACKVS